MSADPRPMSSEGSDPGSARLARHWRRTRALTFTLLALWLCVVLGTGVFARELEKLRFFGWPLSYYMGAQGALLVFLLIIGLYALLMRRIDREVVGQPPPAKQPAGENAPPPGAPQGERRR